jgi:hypothetical protein
MAETLNSDELLSKALGTKLPANPVAEAVSLKPPAPKAPDVDFSGAKDKQAIPVKADYMAAVKPDLDALRVAEEEKLKFAGLEKIDAANREAAKQKALGESAAQQRREILDDPSRAEYKQALEAKAKPFIPHEENAQDLIALFGLLNVVGFAIGAGGKEYSQAAMSAMNGMLEGHQKGREDLYKKEKSIFETNQKQLDSRIKQLLAFMQDNELLTNMDKTARDQAIQGKFLEDGATFLSDYYKKNGYGKTVETLKEMAKASGKAAELAFKEKQRAADQDATIRLEEQKAKERRQEEQDKILAQYDLASLKLTEEAKQAKANNDFRLEEEKSRRAFEVEKSKANWIHGENLAKINRDHLDAIELARIERDKLRDKDTAEYRAAEQKHREKIEQYENDKLKEQIRHNKEQEKIENARIAQTGGIGKLDREVYNIARNNYPSIDPKNLSNLSKESVGRIVNGTRTLEEVEDIAKFIKQKPQAAGAAAKFQNIINYDAIKGIVGESETTAAQKAQMIDNQIDQAVAAGKLTADEASSAKLLQKKLFSLALADVQSSGQRGSVYLDKSFQNLYDQASRPETLMSILADRAHQSNRNLANFDMQVENRKDAGRFDLTTKGAEQWMSENFPMLTPAKVRERIAAGTLKNGDYFRTTDGRFLTVNVPPQR